MKTARARSARRSCHVSATATNCAGTIGTRRRATSQAVKNGLNNALAHTIAKATEASVGIRRRCAGAAAERRRRNANSHHAVDARKAMFSRNWDMTATPVNGFASQPSPARMSAG